MELTTVWFILIAVLWVGYFVLEGFDFGVAMLMEKDIKPRDILTFEAFENAMAVVAATVEAAEVPVRPTPAAARNCRPLDLLLVMARSQKVDLAEPE